MLNEQRYDYPRRFAWPLEFVASVVALAGFVHVGRYLIGMLVHRTEVQKWSLDQDPRLRQIISWWMAFWR